MTPLLIALAIAPQPPSLESRVADLESRVAKLEGKPPVTPPPATPADPKLSIVRIQFGNAGCTAGVILGRRPDGRFDVGTANHCIPGVGSRGTGWLADGRRIALRVTAADRRSDLAWLVTEAADLGDLPAAKLAESLPPRGTRVWQQGWGVDRPGNRETGTVIQPTPDGQVMVYISVSSGDSGGPLFVEATGEVLGFTCCTAKDPSRPEPANTWFGHCLVAARLRPATVAKFDVFGPPLADAWTPLPTPVCRKNTAAGQLDPTHEAEAWDVYRWVLAEVRAGRPVKVAVGVEAGPDVVAMPAGLLPGSLGRAGVYECKLVNGEEQVRPVTPAAVETLPPAPVSLPTCPTCPTRK